MTTTIAIAAGALWLLWVASLVRWRARPELKAGSLREFVFPVAALMVVLVRLAAPAGSELARFLDFYLVFGVLIGVLLTVVWLVSLARRDSSIMDIVYPLTAAIPALVLTVWRGTWSPHEIFTVGLALIWSVRLSGYLAWRNLGHGVEDARYAAWRRRFGGDWWWWSYFQVFVMQGVLIWLWSLPLALALHASPSKLGWQHVVAAIVFVAGFVFQAGGDWQLERFKQSRRDRSEVLSSGLWSVTRHPNYFGEAVIWWSFWCCALVHPWGFATIMAPIYVTWFMAKGSATPMQERYLAKTKPAYAAYVARVPAFFPWSKAGG